MTGGLEMQTGATDLLLAKRSFWLVGALRTGDTVILSLYTSLETASTLVKQGVALRLVFVTSTLLALTLVVANAQLIVSVELSGNTQDIGVPLWGRTVALPPRCSAYGCCHSCPWNDTALDNGLPGENLQSVTS